MKKSLKNLELKKETITNLNTIQGGHCHHGGGGTRPAPRTVDCPTNGAATTCPPAGQQCY